MYVVHIYISKIEMWKRKRERKNKNITQWHNIEISAMVRMNKFLFVWSIENKLDKENSKLIYTAPKTQFGTFWLRAQPHSIHTIHTYTKNINSTNTTHKKSVVKGWNELVLLHFDTIEAHKLHKIKTRIGESE